MQDSGFLDVPHGRLYYEVAGAGQAVVFVHGFTLDTRMWDDQWTVFGERGRVVRYDLRGFGRSEAEPVPYSDLDDLLALLNFLDIERAHLVGLSMGGMVLVHFTLAHPRRVHGLVGRGLRSQWSYGASRCVVARGGTASSRPVRRGAGELARLRRVQPGPRATGRRRATARDCLGLHMVARPGTPVYGVGFSRQR